jgi:hypothetical protein
VRIAIEILIRNVFLAIPVIIASAMPTASAFASETLGFVLTRYGVALHETPGGKEECPNGYVTDDFKQFAALYPSEEQQLEQLRRTGNRSVRGAEGANAFFFPESVKDPLPYHPIEGKVGFGLNLDGTADGSETAKTCKHEKFSSPEGEQADNQLYRLIGCNTAFREGGWIGSFTNGVDMMRPMNRYLLEITGVDNRMNDDAVEVGLYKGKDELIVDASGVAVAWTTQRIDENTPQYNYRAKGKIIKGVLYTEPMDVVMPMSQTTIGPEERAYKGLRMRLNLTDKGAEGLWAAYVDTGYWWTHMTKWAAVITPVIPMSGPATYQAMKKLADGDKDPQTGVCSSISAAYNVKWTPAYIVHPAGNAQTTAAMR